MVGLLGRPSAMACAMLAGMPLSFRPSASAGSVAGGMVPMMRR